MSGRSSKRDSGAWHFGIGKCHASTSSASFLVVGGFFGDEDAVGVAFEQASVGDAAEVGFLP